MTEIYLRGTACEEAKYTGTDEARPGVVLEIDFAGSTKEVFAAKPYGRANDGDPPHGPAYLLMIDYLQGKTEADAVKNGERAFMRLLEHGAVVHVLLKANTGVTKGQALTVEKNTGKVKPASGSEAWKPFVALETKPASTEDQYVAAIVE